MERCPRGCPGGSSELSRMGVHRWACGVSIGRLEDC